MSNVFNINIDIVVVNWNAGRQVLDCVNSIFSSEDAVVKKIVIVDNLSTDGSLEPILELDNSKLKVIKNNENFGFAKGCNIGAGECTSDFILFLNPDTLINETTFSDLNNFLKNYYDIAKLGVLGAQLVNEFNEVSTTCSRFPKVIHFLSKTLGLNKLFKSIYSLNHHMNEFDHLTYREVDQVMGAFFLVPRTLFVQLNGFDDRFFVYFEEVDFCFRAKKLGCKVIFNPEIKAKHIGCGTTESVKGFRLYLSVKSRLKYFKKNSSYLSYFFILIISFGIEPFARMFKALISRNKKDIKDIMLAYKYFIQSKE